MGRRPIPTGPVVDYTNNHRPETLEGPAYLYIPLPKFIEEMRGQYSDWEEFIDSRPWLERELLKEIVI